MDSFISPEHYFISSGMFIIVLAVGVVWVCHCSFACSLPRRGKFTGRVNEFIGRTARVSGYSLVACPSVDCIPSSRYVGLTNPLAVSVTVRRGRGRPLSWFLSPSKWRAGRQGQ